MIICILRFVLVQTPKSMLIYTSPKDKTCLPKMSLSANSQPDTFSIRKDWGSKPSTKFDGGGVTVFPKHLSLR